MMFYINFGECRYTSPVIGFESVGYATERNQLREQCTLPHSQIAYICSSLYSGVDSRRLVVYTIKTRVTQELNSKNVQKMAAFFPFIRMGKAPHFLDSI